MEGRNIDITKTSLCHEAARKRLFDSKLISIRIFDQKFGGKKMIGQFQASLPRFLAKNY